MSAKRDLPFPKGETAWNGEVPTSGVDYTKCGHEYSYTDPTSHRELTLRAVRNESGITLYGKLPVTLNASGTSITGYARLPTDPWCVIDDEIGSNGVEDDDVCYVHVKGPCTVKTASASLSSITAGDYVVAATRASSTAAGTTGSGVNLISPIANATDATGAFANNRGAMARAISAATTNNTDTGIRVNMDARFV
jgi:hypothetical protein